MKCLEFHARLDAGDLDTLDTAARAHAAASPACARALADAEQLEVLLAEELGPTPVAAASHEFTDRLMARVEDTPQARLELATLARSVAAAFATPPIALPALAGAGLLALAASAGFDRAHITAAAASAGAPIARLAADVVRPLPASGTAHDIAITSLALAAVPLVALAVAALWQLGQAIGERTPRAL